jgi:GAF domain-containing protein
MTESIAERAALSLENARLLEDAQKRAAKERAISEGAARVSAALDVENILQATAEELERALGSSEIVIQLESEE